MTQEELDILLHSDESYRIERTISTTNMDKFQEAICAFANDLPGSRKKGYLLIGVHDDGRPCGLKVNDDLMKKISGIRSDGNILPLPVMSTEKVSTKDGDVLVVEVTPSFATPIRYRGRTFVRIGPRRDIASAEEERILSERCAASLPTFDTHPCKDARIEDIDINAIINEYLPNAIDADVLAKDTRPIKEQLASLHLFNIQWDCPTYAALVMFGRNPKYYMPGDFIQYVKYKGLDNGCEILNERRFEGGLYKMLPELENFIRDGIVTKRPVTISVLREKDVLNYPYKALRELLMNAVMHRDYQSNMPIRLYQYDDRIEIMNPGGLYGQARPENFPNVNDYRNSVIAETMRSLNYVNMFNHGIHEVQELLKENENPPAEFNVNLLTVFWVKISSSISKEEKDLEQKSRQVVNNLSSQVKELIINLKEQSLSKNELLDLGKLSYKSRSKLEQLYINPALEIGVIEMLYPETPRHPKQKYRLTSLGLYLLNVILKEAER